MHCPSQTFLDPPVSVPQAEAEFSEWVAARSRATGDGPKAIFADGLAWLRERKVLLPGVTTPIGVFSLETTGYGQSYK